MAYSLYVHSLPLNLAIPICICRVFVSAGYAYRTFLWSVGSVWSWFSPASPLLKVVGLTYHHAHMLNQVGDNYTAVWFGSHVTIYLAFIDTKVNCIHGMNSYQWSDSYSCYFYNVHSPPDRMISCTMHKQTSLASYLLLFTIIFCLSRLFHAFTAVTAKRDL